jgi:hypothetical protein
MLIVALHQCHTQGAHLAVGLLGRAGGDAVFLQDRAALRERSVPIGPSLLFFGCRDLLQDFLYEEELREVEATEVTRLFCAFSREPGERPACGGMQIEAV